MTPELLTTRPPGGKTIASPSRPASGINFPSLFGCNITLTGGPAPARAYIEILPLPDVLTGHVDPGKVFDQEVLLADVADGCRAMDERTALKVLVKP